MPPVSGATLPIAIVSLAGACAFLSSLQPVTQARAAIAITPKWERIMAASGSRRSEKSADYADGPRGCQFSAALHAPGAKRPPAASGKPATNRLPGFAYLTVRMYFARVFASSSPTVPFGGIGMGPHTPVEPSLIFFTR